MINFTVSPEVLRALNVFTDADHAALGFIHVRATADCVMMESTDGHGLLRLYPSVEFSDDSDRTFDVLIPIAEFLPVLKTKLPKYAPNVVSVSIDGEKITVVRAGVSARATVTATVQKYPNTDAIANAKPTFAPVDIIGLGLPMIRNIDKALSFLGCMSMLFTAPNGSDGVYVSRGDCDYGQYELFFMPYKLPAVSDAENKHYEEAAK